MLSYFLMKITLRQSTLPLIIGSIAAVLFMIAFVWVLMPRAEASNQNGRLLTIHDRGQQTSYVTEAETIGEALANAGIAIDERDAVEPSTDQKLLAKEYQVNIYRARPVTVIDGPTRQRVVTPYQSADRIVADAGIALYPEDTTSLAQASDLIVDGAGLKLTIDRATPLTLTLFGTTTAIRTQGETVGEMLKEKGVTLGEHDRSSLALDTPISSDMSVTVWREGKQTVTVEEAVPFETEQIRDADRDVDYKAVQSAGQTGKRNATYEVEIRDGAEISRVEIASIVTTQPVKQVEVIGVKPKTLPYTGGGTKTEWLAASNIPQASWGYADFMVQKESGWNPNAVNRSSGACGLAQALPCSKVPGNPYDPVNSLNWMNGYVNGRYGGWEGAYTFWQKNRWY